MASNALIGEWSSGVWLSLGSPDSLSSLTISGYALQPSTLGKLNSLIGGCYSGSGFLGTGITFDVVPDLNNSELAIVEGLFRVGWYTQLSTIMMGTSPAGIAWASIAEGDSRITRANSANIGKEYRELAKQTQEQMTYLVNAYEIRGSGPRSVDYLNPPIPGYYTSYVSPYGR